MTCKKCQGTGLLPFSKNGRVITDAYLYCTCHPVYGDNPPAKLSHDITPDMFDYPMSDTYRATSYRFCGVPDPGYVPPEPIQLEPVTRVIEHRHSDMSKDDFKLLRNLEGQVKYLQQKLMERQQIRPKQVRPTGYKGLSIE